MSNSQPPGVEVEAIEYYKSGGDSNKWIKYEKVKYYTNAFIVKDSKVLLGLKKRGFGKDKYNGFGGKVDPGETPLQAAKRELKEEAGITAPLEKAGSLFFMTRNAECAFHIDIFRAESYDGEVAETDEMRPEWFCLPGLEGDENSTGLPPIPFSKMWDTDNIWLPLLIAQRKFAGRADFTDEGGIFKPYKWWYGVCPT